MDGRFKEAHIDFFKNNHEEHAIEDDISDDEFWTLTTCAIVTIAECYCNYIHKVPCMVSHQTGIKWMIEILEGPETRCLNMFRMKPDVFLQLCTILEGKYGLRSSRNMSVVEKIGLFIYTLAQGASNRSVQERFQHSGETISRIFNEVLHFMGILANDLLKPIDHEFRDIPSHIANDDRYMPYFKDCIGAIDGTHVHACVPQNDQVRFIGRKRLPTQNVMAVCSFDMQFTFVLAGYEGTAHDSNIFSNAIYTEKLNFPSPPPGKYYLVDAGYPNLKGYLGPYRGVRYHLPEFQRGQPPTGYQEIFNKAHSSLRSCIERTFGVWKKRWKILRDMPSYPFTTQVDVILASMTLHNFIRRYSLADPIFIRVVANPNFVQRDIFQDSDNIQSEISQGNSRSREMDEVCDQIAASLLTRRNYR